MYKIVIGLHKEDKTSITRTYVYIHNQFMDFILSELMEDCGNEQSAQMPTNKAINYAEHSWVQKLF